MARRRVGRPAADARARNGAGCFHKEGATGKPAAEDEVGTTLFSALGNRASCGAQAAGAPGAL